MKLPVKSLPQLLLSLLIGVFSSQLLFAHPVQKDSLTIAKQFKATGDSLQNAQKEVQAVYYYNKALETYTSNALSDDAFLFQLLLDYSYCSGYLGLLNKQTKLLNRAHSLVNSQEISLYSLIVFYQELASFERDSNNYLKGYNYNELALEVYASKTDDLVKEIGRQKADKLKAHSLVGRILFLKEIEGEKEMLAAYNQLEKFAAEVSEADLTMELKYAHFFIGRHYQKRKPKEAIRYFQNALKNFHKNMRLDLTTKVCIGHSYIELEEYDKVKPLLKEVLAFSENDFKNALHIPELASRYSAYIKDTLNLEKYANVVLNRLNVTDKPVNIRMFNEGDFESDRFPVLITEIANHLEISEHGPFQETSYKLYKIALDQFSKLMDHKPLGTRAMSYEKLKKGLLEYLCKNEVDFLVKKHILQRMENIETKADFNKFMQNRLVAKKQTKQDSLFQKERVLRAALTDIKKRQLDQDSIYRKEIFDLELALENINSQLKNQLPSSYEKITENFLFDDLTFEGSTYIKFVVAGGVIYRIDMDNKQISTYNLGNYDTIEIKVNLYLEGITSGSEENTKHLAKELFDTLFKNSNLAEEVVIVPDKSLHYLPFETLIHEESLLLEKVNIRYSKGLAFSTPINFERNNTQKVSLFAPTYEKFTPPTNQIALRGSSYNLAGAKKEVYEIATLFDAAVYEDALASKKQFMATTNTSVIHHAGHAYSNDKDPELASLLFSDSDTDNHLYISELYGLKLDVDLAVLSACNTGIGGIKEGQGVVSIAQAFLFAGVPATVSSLWSAPDKATSDIMIAFYKHLKNGKTKSKALQLAKQDYLNNTKDDTLKHPYYWAGFVLYGDDTPLRLKNNSAWIWWAALGVIFIGAVYVRKRRLAA